MVKITRFLFVALFSVSLILPAYSQDNIDNKKVTTIEGQVVTIDWVASEIVVRWFDSRPGYGYDETKITVTRDATITKGTDNIDLFDININDDVTVRYYDDAFSGLKAVSIVVKI